MTPDSIERDFNSRLQAGEFEDLESYSSYVLEKSHHFNVDLNRSDHALKRIEVNHYKAMASCREPPRKMLELLNEYISEQGVEN